MFVIFIFALSPLGCRKIVPDSTGVPAPRVIQPLRIGVSGDYPPFSRWLDGEEQPAGFSVDVARSYAASQGRPVEWVRFRWSALERNLEDRRFDLALSGVTVRSDRSIAGRVSLPLTTSGAVVLVEARSSLRSPSDLQRPGLSIAVNAGGHLERVARSLLTHAQIRATERNQWVLDRLGRDGVEAVMTDSLEAPIWQKQRPGLRAIGPLTRDRKAAWFPRTGEDEARRFDHWLLDAEAVGLLADLRRSHGLPRTPSASPLWALLASLDERLSLMIGVARAKNALGIEVEDRSREARVVDAALAAVRRSARRTGISAPDDAAIRRLFRAQIEAAKWIQQDWLDSRDPGPSLAIGSSRAKERADLDDRLRPALIFLGDRIAMLVVAAAHGHLTELPFAEVVDALTRHGLPEAHVHSLHDALVGIAIPD